MLFKHGAKTMTLEPIRAWVQGINQRLDSARPAVQMWVFTAAGVFLTSIFFFLTRPAVEIHESQRLMQSLKEMMPEIVSIPGILDEAVEIPAQKSGSLAMKLYRLREGTSLQALFLKTITPYGYSGNIEFTMTLKPDGRIVGVRVLRHRETPGLGDWIETARSKWIFSFEGKSLRNTPEMLWHVKKDGGIFDQFTGATITPRAMVKGVHETLKTLKEQGETREDP